MTTVCDPAVGRFRAWEDQGREGELIETVADEIWGDILNREALTTSGKSPIRDEIQEAVWQELCIDTETLRQLVKAALFYSDESSHQTARRTQAQGYIKDILASLKTQFEVIVDTAAATEYDRRVKQAEEDVELADVD